MAAGIVNRRSHCLPPLTSITAVPITSFQPDKEQDTRISAITCFNHSGMENGESDTHISRVFCRVHISPLSYYCTHT